MDRRYLIAVLFVVAAILVVAMLVYPKYQQIGILTKAVDERQREFDSQNQLVQDIDRLKKQHQRMGTETSLFAKLLPAFGPRSATDLFIELEGLTLQSGIALEEVNFSEKKPSGTETETQEYRTLEVDLVLKGDYQSFKNFARAVEASEHLMDIVLVDFRGSQSAGEGAGTEEVPAEGTESSFQAELYSFKTILNAYYQ